MPIGYSDHTLGIDTCVSAVSAGAIAIEKHFTYRKTGQDFRDHQLSADPQDLKELVQKIRATEILLGSKTRRRQPEESKIIDTMRRSLAAARDLPAGSQIEEHQLTGLRPNWGISVDLINHVIGKSLCRSISKGELIQWSDLEDKS